jgi:hypothetical protein
MLKTLSDYKLALRTMEGLLKFKEDKNTPSDVKRELNISYFWLTEQVEKFEKENGK